MSNEQSSFKADLDEIIRIDREFSRVVTSLKVINIAWWRVLKRKHKTARSNLAAKGYK